MPWNRRKLPSAHRAIIEALETRLLLSVGLLTTDQDIGSPAQGGSAVYSNGVYTLTAGGTGIGGSSDQFNFAYETSSGNFTLVTQLNSLTDSSSSAQAGLMIRSDTTVSAAMVAVLVTPGSGVELITRTADGGTAGQITAGGIQAPEYLELSMTGSAITAYFSSNGATWSQLGSSQTIAAGSSPLIGLAADSASGSQTTTAAFSKLNLLPAGWSDNDIGSPPLPGSAGYNGASNTFTVLASGSGIGSTSDQFNFLNYALTGNGSITALVDSLTNTNPSAGAGVMIRSDTTAGSLFAAVDLTPQNTVVFAGRSGTGAFASSPLSVSGPVWLSVTDSGGTFNGYYSTDDINWTQIGTPEAIAMPSATTLAGLWASSNNASALNTAVFSGVSLLRGGWTDTDIGAPAITGSSVYDSPSDTATVNGNGADIYGSSDQFNFNSTTMIGNGSAIAYVDSITNTNAWAKAGVMIRNDVTAGSEFAAVLVSPTSGITFEWRSTAGGAVSQEISSPAGGPTPAPVGLELTRSGNTFTAYYSTDGMTWIAVGASQTVALNSTALAGLAVTSHNTGQICTAAFSSVSIGSNPPPDAGIYSSTDQSFLNNLEDAELQYFWDESSPTTGLVPDNANANGGNPSADSSIAAIGFGLTALTIGDARGWLSHANAYQRALTTIDFLYSSGANVNGFFYHFLNSSGGRYGSSEISSVDNAELMSGVLAAAQYWAGTPLQSTALAMFDRVDWPWMQQASGVFYGAWTPESGFSGGYGDFSEAALLYLIAMGSPTYPTSVASWYSWSRTPVENYSGYSFVEADDAALFTEQYPQDWFDLQGLTDKTGLNFYTNSQTATLAQRQFMINLHSTYSDYGPNLWGLTPSEGVSGYTVWGGPPANGPINGTVVPAAAGGSLEFEPRLSLNVLENMDQTYPSEYQKYGLVDAFNPLTSWSSSLDLGIDLGPTLIAAENARSNLVWNEFMQTSAAQQAVAKAFPSTSTSVWAVNGSGNWNIAANWTNSTIPNAAGAVAELLDVTPPAQTVYSNTAITLGTLHFNSANEYELTGTGSLTLESTGSNSALVEVDQGTIILDLPITLASNTVFNVAAGATLIIGNPLTINSGVALTQIGGGTVTYESIVSIAGGASVSFEQSTYAQSLSLSPGATASVTGNGAVLEVGNLSGSGTLNLQNNTLLINYGAGPDPMASIRADVISGYAGGSWTGPGIMSTTAQANSASYGLGYADSADPGNPAALASGTIEVMYTLLGDANLDGKVNGADFNIMSANFNQSGKSWDQGDFNYDGNVNGTDFVELSSNFNQASNAAAAVMPVISSATFATLGLTQTSTAPTGSTDENLLNSVATDSPGVLNASKKAGQILRQGNHHPRT